MLFFCISGTKSKSIHKLCLKLSVLIMKTIWQTEKFISYKYVLHRLRYIHDIRCLQVNIILITYIKLSDLTPFSKLSCYFILQTIDSLTCSHDYYFKDTYYDSLLPVSKNAIGMAALFVCLLAVKVPSSSNGF